MAIAYKDIRRAVRFKERDNDEVRFSDYEIKEATNEALRWLSNSLADSNADFNEKQRFYNQKDYAENFKCYGIELPDDFLSLVAVKGKPHIDEIFRPCLSSESPNPWEYKVMGDRIYVGSSCFCLVYKAVIPEIRDEEDEVELPNFAKDYFVTLVRRILTNAEETVMREAQELVVNALIPKRRYRNAKIRMPFKIHNNCRHWW